MTGACNGARLPPSDLSIAIQRRGGSPLRAPATALINDRLTSGGAFFNHPFMDVWRNSTAVVLPLCGRRAHVPVTDSPRQGAKVLVGLCGSNRHSLRCTNPGLALLLHGPTLGTPARPVPAAPRSEITDRPGGGSGLPAQAYRSTAVNSRGMAVGGRGIRTVPPIHQTPDASYGALWEASRGSSGFPSTFETRPAD